ncbi:MAG: ATPase, T2SS/T4P/T4SS family, partial [Anaerolineales bacterium]|nr:ATPase, T2SS/T4P/T4SS family [Anaerolineales bacterium]
MATFPHDGEEIESYTVSKGIEVTIFELPHTVQYLYHVMPPEFKLSEEKYEILDTARKIMAEHKPKRSEFVDPERMRQVFLNVGSDLIDELAAQRGVNMASAEIEQLTNILVRYTVGFGLIEVLLQDEKVQDITINNQIGDTPMFIVHQDYGDCKTNIVPTMTEAESWATKLRLVSGRPLDESNPILDTELNIKGANARVAAVGRPLNPYGLAYAFRRHRDRPWTLPLFINNKMVSPLASGLLSFLIDGSRTMLVAGTRSAGKTALLGSLLVELMRKYRVITIEDTLELPTTSLRKLGYNIQPMKVAAALTKGSAEVSAEEGIRTTLRMGDSALIVGEIRSK